MPMVPERWLVLTVTGPAAGDGGALAAWIADELIALGGTAVEEDGDRLTTYVPAPDDPEAWVRRARERLDANVPGYGLEVTWRWQPNEDWAREWRRGLKPRRVGRRLIVAPSWTRPERGEDDIVVWIDPQMAFGTGEHATTRGVLRLLESAVRPGDRVLDVGTGSGILAIAAAKLGAGVVLGVENDADALLNARENLERNGVADRVLLAEATVDPSFLEQRSGDGFDLIVANVLSSVLVPLLDSFRGALAGARRPGRGARLILGGILTSEAATVIEAARRAGFRLEAEDVEEERWSGCFVAEGPAAPPAAG